MVNAVWLRFSAIYFLAGFFIVACDDAPARDPVLTFNGICDGSAAVRIGRSQLLVAYDETNSLYTFDAEGGEIQQTLDLGKVLSLEQSTEMDLEAAVVHDGGVWWIGSHGLNGDALAAPNRRSLFKTSLPSIQEAGGIQLLDGPFDLGDLLKTVVDGSAATLAPKSGGINVEGMSVTATGDLLIALRSPLTNVHTGDAIVLKIASTPDARSFELSEVYQLSLADRGIRDIVISDNGYLLIAGAVDTGGDFSVYRWQLSGELEELFAVPSGFNAEALVDMGHYWLVLSDDGKVKRPDQQAADGDRRCDNIVKKNSFGQSHENVFFRGLKFTDK